MTAARGDVGGSPEPPAASLSRRMRQEAAVAEVLVVDAENLTRRLLAAPLESAGHLVRTAASAAAAQKLVAQFGCPDVLVIDLLLPADSAPRLVAQLRAEPGAADLPVIFLSGRGTPRDAGCLPKPVSPEALTAAVGAAVQTLDAAVEQTVRSRLAGFGSLDDFEQDLIAELLTAFVQRAPAAQLAAEQAIATDDAGTLQSSTRRLAAAARNLGADDLAEICADLDARAGRGEFPIPVAVTARFRRLLGAGCRVFAALAAEFRNERPDALDAGLIGVAQA
jgi:CheY-like chemotaxis protein